MTRILFICHGNICRSPMAEFVLKAIAAEHGLADALYIASAATSAEELGNPVHPGARKKLREHGIGCSGKTARRVTRDDYDNFDLLIGMDEPNIRDTVRIMGGDPDGKIHLLLEYCGSRCGIADPWYTGNFDATWDDIREGCSALFDYLYNTEKKADR
ncbi:MAG: low molecular weight protein-tyrosine-phosphatase [Oscillospiraceae bacterium]